MEKKPTTVKSDSTTDNKKVRARTLPAWMSGASATDSCGNVSAATAAVGGSEEEKKKKRNLSNSPSILEAGGSSVVGAGAGGGSVRKFHYVMSPRELEILAKNIIQEVDGKEKR